MQGQFSFVLFDGEKRQVFAARDSSVSEPLYYALDEDGAVSLSNDQPPVPTADEGRVQVRGAVVGCSGRAEPGRCWGCGWQAWCVTFARSAPLLLDCAAALPTSASLLLLGWRCCDAHPCPPPLLSPPHPLQWCELPPGHFISGRSPKVQQFALTPQQLSIRET